MKNDETHTTQQHPLFGLNPFNIRSSELDGTMKKRRLIGFVSCILITFLWVGVGVTEDFFTFSELTSYRPFWSLFGRFLVIFTQFTIRTEISLAGVDINRFNEDTQFQIQLNEFRHSGTLGQDPRYIAGKKNANIRYYNSDTSKRPLFTVNLKWNEEQLTATITGPKYYNKLSFLELTSIYFGDDSGPVEGTTSAIILLRDAQGVLLDAEFDVAFKGTVSTNTFRVTEWYTNKEYDLNLSKLRIRGSGIRVYGLSAVSPEFDATAGMCH